MKKYFFVLGSNKELSLAELSAIFPENKWQKFNSIVISEFLLELEVKSLISSLGGIIKIGEVTKEINLANRHSLSENVKKELIQSAKSAKREELLGKFNFGFSFYEDVRVPGDFFKLGLAIKKDLKNIGISSRMVTSKEKILSSVVVEQNNLISKGLELCLITDKKSVFLGKTLAVQPFKALSRRDFGRPQRDDHSGMIPPKLAQIMINLVRRDDKDYNKKTLLDPFCGSGTILTEAYLMNFKKIIGSDLSAKAISDSAKNIDWIIDWADKGKDKQKEKNIFEVFQSDILNLDDKIEKNSIDYIVCEPYLGPQRGYKNFNEVVVELNELYSKALEVFYKILKPGGRVVMIWPQFRAEGKIWKISPDIKSFKVFPILADNNDSIVYGRVEQKVWREIVVLEK
ncbi:MAG: methyltransferase domain-containing protein [Patescibacteria group bacterium]|nr:methyltransferase domain-containing protein [Patescibacteria group bacterium]